VSLPNGSTGISDERLREEPTARVVSRRSVLTSIPFAVFTMMAVDGCEGNQPATTEPPRTPSRLFGLASTGLDDATVQRSQAATQQLGKHLDVLTVYDAFFWEKPLPTAFLDAAAAASRNAVGSGFSQKNAS
jgi:mannan endo-1,4-beta-mannosidase